MGRSLEAAVRCQTRQNCERIREIRGCTYTSFRTKRTIFRSVRSRTTESFISLFCVLRRLRCRFLFSGSHRDEFLRPSVYFRRESRTFVLRIVRHSTFYPSHFIRERILRWFSAVDTKWLFLLKVASKVFWLICCFYYYKLFV